MPFNVRNLIAALVEAGDIPRDLANDVYTVASMSEDSPEAVAEAVAEAMDAVGLDGSAAFSMVDEL